MDTKRKADRGTSFDAGDRSVKRRKVSVSLNSLRIYVSNRQRNRFNRVLNPVTYMHAPCFGYTAM